MGKDLQLYRGPKASMPVLLNGQPVYVTDEKRIYIGNSDETSIGIPNMDDLAANAAASLNFSSAGGEDGLWDRAETTPTGTTPIRYNGYLRATRVYGVYYSDSADYAEAYNIDEDVEPGDIVAVKETGAIGKSQRANDPCVLGVVSTDPAQIIGGEGVPLALSGRMPVKVSGVVKPGNFLASSDAPGCAHVVDPETVPRGCIVAMALEGKDNTDVGTIMAFALRL